MESRIRIAVNVFIHNLQGEILLGQRKGGTGAGEWCLPGGKLEFCEHLKTAAVREVEEETGIKLVESELKPANITNDPRPNFDEHWIHFNYKTTTKQEPRLTEPDHFYEWRWFNLVYLPQPIFYGQVKMIEAYKVGQLLAD